MITPEERAELMHDITEHVLLLLPAIISHLINNMATMREVTTKFYDDNKDLLQHKSVVGQVVEQIESKNPGRTYQEILALAEPEVRQLIGRKREIDKLAPVGLKQLDKALGNL